MGESGDRLEESKKINLSLSALAKVMSTLCDSRVTVVHPLPHSGIPPPSLGGTVEVADLVGPRPATTGSSGCI